MIFTFYSFKGGVGRSMAMANVAWELASRGLRVLTVDFDLEAPGLERYFDVPVPEVHDTRGVIDLISAFKRSLGSSGGMGPEAEFRRYERFIYRPVADFGRGGRLDLMPAGRRGSDDDKRAYALAVRTFDWQDFYFNWEGQAFFEWLRRTLVEGPDAPYDVVLADSRTGVTEMGGVCACQLADVVVMLSAPNQQNIEGTLELADDLLSEPVQRLRPGRPPLSIVVVPARVEQRVPELLAKFNETFESRFKDFRPAAHVALGLRAQSLALPYVPEFAFQEQVTHERSESAGVLTEQYRRLADAILVLCGESASPALATAVEAARERLSPEHAEADVAVSPAAAAFDPTKRFAGADAYLSCPRSARSVVQQVLDALTEMHLQLRTEFGEAEAFGTERDLPLTAREQLRHAAALVLCADAQGVRPWQRAELKAARSLASPPALVRVLLPGAAEDAFELAFGEALRDATLIDLRRWPHERSGLEVIVEALRAVGRSPEARGGEVESRLESSVAAEVDPFPGAVAYGEQHAAFFGGRAGEIESLHAAVAANRRVVLRGDSGTGKTSLVLAGLFPRLRSEGVHTLRHADLRHAGRYWQEQLQALRDLPDGLVVLDHLDECADEVMDLVSAWWADGSGPRLLLVWRAMPLAQAELMAQGTAGTSPGADDPGHADHHACLPSAAVSRLLASLRGAATVELAPLATPVLRAALEDALSRAGRRAESGLVERLFTDAGSAPQAATLQRVMLLLWQQQARGWLTNEAYDRAGGVDGSFVSEIERQLAATPGHDRPGLDGLLLRLLRRRASDGALVLDPLSWARSISQPVFGGRAATLVLAWACAGLLVLRREGPDISVELAHLPRACAGLDPLREASSAWLSDVLRVADAYRHWARREDFDEADEVVRRGLDAAAQARLSRGELAWALRRQAHLKRRRVVHRVVQAAVVLLILSGVVGTYFQSSRKAALQDEAAAAAAAASAAELAKTAAYAVAQARAQQEQTATAGVTAGTGADKLVPRPNARVIVVAHRTGTDAADERLVAELLRVLPADRFEVQPRIERRNARACGDVRFHHDQDADAARDALTLLNREFERLRDVRSLQLNDRRAVEASSTVKPGTLEIWLPPLTNAPLQREDRWGSSRLVPAGCALLGSDPDGRETLRRGLGAADAKHFSQELPVLRAWVDSFYIGRTEVTARAFAAYQAECERSRAGACPPWRPRFLDPKTEPERPATFVTWEQARDYCQWAGGRLPSDLEWEKAARGTDGRFWPWGFQPDATRYQGKGRTPARPLSVGSFPVGDSPYGVADMAGNVYEYTADLWDDTDHAIRGGSYLNTLMESRASVRWASRLEKEGGAEYLGFRCVADVKR